MLLVVVAYAILYGIVLPMILAFVTGPYLTWRGPKQQAKSLPELTCGRRQP